MTAADRPATAPSAGGAGGTGSIVSSSLFIAAGSGRRPASRATGGGWAGCACTGGA
jgi:hypothetical protein